MLPIVADFPPGTEFVIKEFDVPLAHVPGQGWFNWYGGTPHPYDVRALRVDNNWLAESFEEWVGIVAASMQGRAIIERHNVPSLLQGLYALLKKWL